MSSLEHPGYAIVTFDQMLQGECGEDVAELAAQYREDIEAGISGRFGPSLLKNHDLPTSRDPSLPKDMRVFYEPATRSKLLAYEDGIRWPAPPAATGEGEGGTEGAVPLEPLVTQPPGPRENLGWIGPTTQDYEKAAQRAKGGPGRTHSRRMMTQIATFLPEPEVLRRPLDHAPPSGWTVALEQVPVQVSKTRIKPTPCFIVRSSQGGRHAFFDRDRAEAFVGFLNRVHNGSLKFPPWPMHWQSDPPKDPKEDPNDDFCAVCKQGGDMFTCSSCPRSFHALCVGYKEDDDALKNADIPYYCLLCQNKEAGKLDGES